MITCSALEIGESRTPCQECGSRATAVAACLLGNVLGDSPYEDVFTGMLTDSPDIGVDAMSGGTPRDEGPRARARRR